MVRLNLRVDLHEDRLYPVGNRVAGVVDVVEELDEVPRQNVVVVIRVRWVSPPKTQEHWQRGAKAEEIFYPELNDIERGGRIEGDKNTDWKWRKLPEYEAGLCCGGNRGLAQALLPELSSLKVRIGSGFLSKLFGQIFRL